MTPKTECSISCHDSTFFLRLLRKDQLDQRRNTPCTSMCQSLPSYTLYNAAACPASRHLSSQPMRYEHFREGSVTIMIQLNSSFAFRLSHFSGMPKLALFRPCPDFNAFLHTKLMQIVGWLLTHTHTTPPCTYFILIKGCLHVPMIQFTRIPKTWVSIW